MTWVNTPVTACLPKFETADYLKFWISASVMNSNIHKAFGSKLASHPAKRASEPRGFEDIRINSSPVRDSNVKVHINSKKGLWFFALFLITFAESRVLCLYKLLTGN